MASIAQMEFKGSDMPGPAQIELYARAGSTARALPNVFESRNRTNQLIASLCSDRNIKMAQKYLDHWWGECLWQLEPIANIDAVLDTMVERPLYRSYGSKVLGPHINFQSREEARTMYRAMLDNGLLPGMPFENDHWAFGDWGLSHEAEHVGFFTGAQLAGYDPNLDRQLAYIARIRVMMVIPYDAERNLLRGEIAYLSDPIGVELAEPGDKDLLCGRKHSGLSRP